MCGIGRTARQPDTFSTRSSAQPASGPTSPSPLQPVASSAPSLLQAPSGCSDGSAAQPRRLRLVRLAAHSSKPARLLRFRATDTSRLPRPASPPASCSSDCSPRCPEIDSVRAPSCGSSPLDRPGGGGCRPAASAAIRQPRRPTAIASTVRPRQPPRSSCLLNHNAAQAAVPLNLTAAAAAAAELSWWRAAERHRTAAG